ncbi:MAG: hypothetical protein PHV16_01660 [Candidatus Nanoarchaeia archaeon]|nr:hypothetical protein [Candidatus Nanoarchaeia archaeon]
MKANNLANLIAWILIVLGVIFIIWKLIGGSPTEFSILITLTSGILFKIIALSSDLSTIKEKVKNIDFKFNALAHDFKEHIKNV